MILAAEYPRDPEIIWSDDGTTFVRWDAWDDELPARPETVAEGEAGKGVVRFLGAKVTDAEPPVLDPDVPGVRLVRPGLVVVDGPGVAGTKSLLWLLSARAALKAAPEDPADDIPSCFITPGNPAALHLLAHLASPPGKRSLLPATPTETRWRVLPAYGGATIADRMCCPRTGAVELHAAAEPLPPESVWADTLTLRDHAILPADVLRQASSGLPTLAGGRFTMTVRDEQFLRDRRCALLRLIDGLIAALRRMLMTMLAASARSPAIGFLLAMLATTRHFGRRGEPDHYAPLACVRRTDVCGGLAMAA
jgi:hypothetical protein